MAEKHTCCAEVWRGTEWRPRKEACGCKASVERDGKWYCKRHDPVVNAEKRAEKQRIADAEWDAKQKRWRLESAAPDLLAALKAYPGPLVCDTQLAAWESQARAAISKAEGES